MSEPSQLLWALAGNYRRQYSVATRHEQVPITTEKTSKQAHELGRTPFPSPSLRSSITGFFSSKPATLPAQSSFRSNPSRTAYHVASGRVLPPPPATSFFSPSISLPPHKCPLHPDAMPAHAQPSGYKALARTESNAKEKTHKQYFCVIFLFVVHQSFER